jgi:hypothetical protein
MTPSEQLIVRTMQDNLDEGFDATTSLIRSANVLGLDRKRVLEIWVQSLADTQVSA